MVRLTTLACVLVLTGLLSSTTNAGNSPNVAAKAAMERTLPDIKFTNVAMRDCFDFLRDVSGANIHINWKALEAAGVTQETQVNIRLRSVPLRKVLDLLLSESGASAGLTYYVDEGVIEVTTKELSDKIMITKVYNVEDLLVEIGDFSNSTNFSLNNANTNGNGNNNGYNNNNNNYNNNNNNNNNRNNRGNRGNGGGMGGGGMTMGGGGGGGGGGGNTAGKTKEERGQALVDLVIETIQPEIWRKNGGPAAIRFWQGSLIVTAPRSVQERIGGPID